ncbi:MAG: hypothetical protein H6744_21215 [Deltaproteobacteria bacterium]|nr:hypothetical protein [Deltaproteobacteria bacterium]
MVNAVSIRFFDDAITEFQWEGGYKIRRVTRASGGRSWLQLILAAGGPPTSFQGKVIEDRRAFLVELRPAGIIAGQ